MRILWLSRKPAGAFYSEIVSKNSTLGVYTNGLEPYLVCKVELMGECLSFFSVAAIKHHDQEFIGGL